MVDLTAEDDRAHQMRVADRICLATNKMKLTASQAARRAEWMMRRGFVRPGCHVEPYACAECGTHHVGNRRIVFPED